MATRATYQIGKRVFYCHWDGYPTGAAQRFAAMVGALTVAQTNERAAFDAIEDRRGGFEFAFIRGVLDAEPTPSHEHHGDTEYRYIFTTDASGLCWVDVRPRNHSGAFVRSKEFELVDWLNEMRRDSERQLRDHYARQKIEGDPRADAVESIPIVVRVEEQRDAGNGTAPRFTYATFGEACKITALLLKHASGFPEGNANKPYYLSRWEAWRAAVAGGEALAA